MGPVERSLEEWREQIYGHRSGGWGKHQGSQEEFGEDGVAMGPVKQTADQVSRDQDWRELDRQEWICMGGKVFGQASRKNLIKI